MSKKSDMVNFLFEYMELSGARVYGTTLVDNQGSAKFSPDDQWVDIFDQYYDDVQIVGKKAIQQLGEFLIECAGMIKDE